LVAIQELDYRPSLIARRLSLGKTLQIAVIVPFFTRPVFVERLRGIEHALAQSDYDLVLYNVETIDRRDDCFRDVARRERVDGLLIMSLLPQDRDVQRFLHLQVPTLLIDARHPSLHSLNTDDLVGGRQFGFVSSRDRFLGYYQALEAADIPFRPQYHKQGEHSQLEACKLTLELLSMPDPPTAIFAASDTQAIGVLAAVRELGQRVPEDLSVIGYDDIEIAEYLHLTTVRQPSFTLGIEGVEMLIELIKQPDLPVREEILPTELVIRATAAPPTIIKQPA
jgi:DNA-binding LacI/PurR family transcriptional regulator